MKEVLATTLLLLGVLAVTYLPSRRAVIALGFVLAALILTRAPAAAALAVATTVAIVIAGWRAEGRLLSRAVIVFGLAIFGGVLAVVAVVSRGNLTGFFHQYEAVIRNMFHQYQGGNLAHAPYDAVKSLVTPLPWAFDSVARSWDRMLYPGMWLLFCALPLAVVGARRVWRSPEGWAIIVTVATALLIHTITAGFVFRQRSMVEPLILLLALAGATSWRMAARCAAGALTVTAVYAGGQSRSPLLALAIAVVAGLVLLASRRLPSRSFDPPPESTMVAAFRELADPDTAALTSTASRVKREVIHLLVALRSMLASARAAIVRHAPGRSSGPTAGEDAAPEDAPSSPLARAMLAARTELQRAAPKADAHARTAPGRPRPARGRGTALEHLAPPLGSGGSGGRLAAAMDTARSHRAALARLAPGVGSGGSDVEERR
jgi:hypothetical protein